MKTKTHNLDQASEKSKDDIKRLILDFVKENCLSVIERDFNGIDGPVRKWRFSDPCGPLFDWLNDYDAIRGLAKIAHYSKERTDRLKAYRLRKSARHYGFIPIWKWRPDGKGGQELCWWFASIESGEEGLTEEDACEWLLLAI